jgi:hypothetical protein
MEGVDGSSPSEGLTNCGVMQNVFVVNDHIHGAFGRPTPANTWSR